MTPILTCLTGVDPSPASGMVYDANSDALIITDADASFVGNIDLVWIYYDFNSEVYLPDFVVDSASQITLPAFAATYQGSGGAGFPGFVQHVEVYQDALVLPYPGTLVFQNNTLIDLTDPLDPAISAVTSPLDNRLQIDGLRFLTAATEPVDRIIVKPAAIPGIDYYDPTGPNAGLNPVGATFPIWTDTQIVIQDPALDGLVINRVTFRNAANTNSLYALEPYPNPAVL